MRYLKQNRARQFQSILTAFLLFTLSCCLNTPASGQTATNRISPPLTIVTEHLPPLQVVENGVAIKGMSVDIVKAMLEVTGEKAVIQGLNWARAYKMALDQENVMIFSITRNHIRENQFHWVGLLQRLDSHLWKLKSRKDIKINNLEQAKQFSIAVPQGDIQHQILLDRGFSEKEKLVVVSRYSQSLNMLLINRVDLIIGNTMVLKDKLSPLGRHFDELEPVLEIRNNIGDIYIAFSLKTPIKQVERYRAALKLIKQNGVHQTIINKYLEK